MSSINEFLGFNPQETEAAESFEGRQEPIPNGLYKAVATSARRKHTKKGDGWFWEIVFTLIEGEHEGHTITHRFNMSNPSEDAVLIGRSQMKRYLDCIGNLEPNDEDALCNIAVLITVANKKSTYYTNRSGEQTTGINMETMDDYFNIKNTLVWLKHPGTGLYYQNSYETILFHCNNGRRFALSNAITGIKSFNGGAQVTNGKRVHPTQKPVELMEKLITDSTHQGMTVLDPMMGSGSTGMACIRTGRHFIGMEIQHKYFDIACMRIERACAENLIKKPIQSTPVLFQRKENDE